MVGQKEDTGSNFTEQDILEWEENTRRKMRETRAEQDQGRAAKRRKRWKREPVNCGKRAGEQQQEGAARKRRRISETRAAEKFRSWFTPTRRSQIQEQEKEQPQPGSKLNTTKNHVKSAKVSDQFVKIREIFEKKEEKKLSDVPKSSEYKALQSESQNQPVKKSISTRSTKKTPMGAVKSPPRKKTNYCKVLSSKVKKTPSKIVYISATSWRILP